MPLLPALGVVFITLKLLGYIAWSWWWVLAPFWVLVLIIVGITFWMLCTYRGKMYRLQARIRNHLRQGR